MSWYQEIKGYFSDTARNLKCNVNVDMNKLSDKILTYDGDHGCAAHAFYEQLGDNTELLNKVASSIADTLEKRLADKKSIDFGKVTQNVFEALSGKEHFFTKELQKRMLGILDNRRYIISICNRDWPSVDNYFSETIFKNFLNKKQVYIE